MHLKATCKAPLAVPSSAPRPGDDRPAQHDNPPFPIVDNILSTVLFAATGELSTAVRAILRQAPVAAAG